ncbi:MAG: hypothetical protein U0W40_07690 [Acidimicrobiia bacterium]
MENLVASILRHDGYPDLEEDRAGRRHALTEKRAGAAPCVEQRTESPRFKVVGFDQPFNFSAKISAGAACAVGQLHFLLLNDDIEITRPDWVDHRLAAVDPEISTVGPRLVFDDGRLQHVGVTLSEGHAGHPFTAATAPTPTATSACRTWCPTSA